MPMPVTTFSLVVGTEACDGHCRFCVSAMTGYGSLPACRKINRARFVKAARFAQIGDTTTVLMTGKGEPTLYPDEVTEYLVLLRPWQFPFVEIQTNALRIGRLAAGKAAGNLTRETLERWHSHGLNTIAISVVGVRPEHNRLVYADDYPDLATTIAFLHDIGFSVRLCVMMHKGFVDGPDSIEEVVEFCKDNAVEQLTIRPIRKPARSASGEHAEYTRANGLTNRRVRAVRRWLDGPWWHLWWRRGRGNKVLTLRHGDTALAPVYDVDGQNLALADCLTVNSESDAIRTLIFYSDGTVKFDWQYQGARLL